MRLNGCVYKEWLIWFHIWSCNGSPYPLDRHVKRVLSSSYVNIVSVPRKFYLPHSEYTLKKEAPGDGCYLWIPHILFAPDMSYFRPNNFRPGGVSKFVEMSELCTVCYFLKLLFISMILCHRTGMMYDLLRIVFCVFYGYCTFAARHWDSRWRVCGNPGVDNIHCT